MISMVSASSTASNIAVYFVSRSLIRSRSSLRTGLRATSRSDSLARSRIRTIKDLEV
jgi:hypothetical protein